MPQEFHQDCIALAAERVRAGCIEQGRIGRRGLLGGLAALGLAAAPRAGRAQGTPRELVMVNWGGLANQGFSRFYGEPFAAANPGWKVVQDSTGPATGKIRSMVESGSVTWDLCDSSTSGAIVLGKRGLVEKIDYGVVQKADVLDPSFALEYGAAPYAFSSVLIYDSSKFATPPTGWRDFFDLKKFPGTRLMRRDAVTALDSALVSLGADPKTMYPLDIPKALARQQQIRGNCVYWNNGSESEQYMRTGEAVMGLIWHTRASVLERESKGRLKFIWDQGMLQAGIMVIPRGNPGGAMAQRLLASAMHDPQAQVGLLQLLGNGPTNPRAAALVPPEFRRLNPTDPENAAKQFVMSGDWWGENYTQANADFLDMISG